MSEHIESLANEIIRFTGTDQNDNLSLECTIDKCKFTLNTVEVNFPKSKLRVHSLEIDTGKGNDSIKIVIEDKVVLQRIKIYPGEGNNKIYTILPKPYSSATIYLENGNNTIITEEYGSNIFITGFKNSSYNKLQIRSSTHTYNDVKIIKENENSNVFNLLLKSSLSDEYSLICSLFNTFSPYEYQMYGTVSLISDDGRIIPEIYNDWKYVLEGPMDLSHVIFDDQAIIFSKELDF